MLEVLSSVIRAILYWLLLELFSQRQKNFFFNLKDIGMLGFLTIVQLVFESDKFHSKQMLVPIIVMLILVLHERFKYDERSIKQNLVLVMEVYVIFVLCGSMAALVGCVYDWLVGKNSAVYVKVLLTILTRIGIIVFIWWKYTWLQRHLQDFARYIMVILGAFLLFFEQFFWMAHIKDDNSFMSVLLLLIYFAMLYTALMNLQHRHLTADNQRILDDNQRMSQEIHRSRDVIDVVSRVVATEDTIDPKLRQELADFCKSEKQEMFDPDLAASLIGDTGMDLLNALLRDKLCQCRQQEISFEVMIPGPIDTYVSDIGIGEAELLRVINDLVKNAVTAINKTDGEVREILLILAVGPSDCLELCVYDSGVPFPDFILERFGERGNTTTGTGNGLADTVNTLRTYDASIEIEAIDPGTDIYTKCVRICFDGKNEIHI